MAPLPTTRNDNSTTNVRLIQTYDTKCYIDKTSNELMINNIVYNNVRATNRTEQRGNTEDGLIIRFWKPSI